MGRFWLRFKEQLRNTLFHRLWTYPSAIAIGLCFVGIIAQRYPKQPDTMTMAITFGVALIGIQLVAIVIYDNSKKYNAKRKLGLFLVELPDDDLQRLRTIVSSATFPILYGYPIGNEQFDRRPFGWQRLLLFLNNEPLGSTASRALFQPSLAGRLRYLDSALTLARERRFASNVL
jgi:hypothetical protein